jgi:succinate dehydrogenase hydrophobic anchor subunit
MIPMVKTIDLLRLAAGVLHARSGINITITETPSTLSCGVSIFQVMKA